MSGNRRAVMWRLALVFGMTIPHATWGQNSPAEPAAPISKSEALEFGKGLAAAITWFDSKAVEEAMDMEAMLGIVAEGIKAPAGYREAFLNGARAVWERNGPPLIIEIKPAIQAGADLHATKGMEWQNRPAVLLRMLLPDGGFSYNVFLLERRSNGRIRAVDYYALASGELASETFRRMYLAGIAQTNRGVLARLLGRDQALLKHINDLTRMAAANREERAEEVLAIYKTLPEEVKNEKIAQILRCSAAQRIDDETYLEAIQDFAKRFPGDPACDFLLISGYLLMDEPEKSLECLERVAKALDNDAYLEELRGSILMTLNRPADAIKAYRAAITEEPELQSSYEGLLYAALEEKRFDEVVEMLVELESRFDEEISDLSELEDFEEFLTSPEGKAWVKTQESEMPESEMQESETQESETPEPVE